jgi:hypothetical protein
MVDYVYQFANFYLDPKLFAYLALQGIGQAFAKFN